MSKLRDFALWCTRRTAAFGNLSKTRQFLTIAALSIGLMVLGVAAALPSFTNSATVGTVTATDTEHPFAPNDLRPADCKTAPTEVNVTDVVASGEPVAGDDAGNLLLGNDGTLYIVGGSAPDCIVGNPGSTIDGDGDIPNEADEDDPTATGDDVCIGDNTVHMFNCEHEFRTP